MNSKRRCTSCRDYFPYEEITRQGVCGDACLQALMDKARNKHKRRQIKTRSSLPSAGSDTRRRVRSRDGGRCRWCGSDRDLQVHHIAYRSEGGSNTVINLITLCLEHHEAVHSNKRLYQPVLRGLIWLHYVEGKTLSVPQFMRWFPEVAKYAS